jgi:hypothetical protein
MGSSDFGTFIISPKVFAHQQILLTSCRESVRKGLKFADSPLEGSGFELFVPQFSSCSTRPAFLRGLLHDWAKS